MSIPEPPTTGTMTNLSDYIVMVPPNDNTDGQDCACGHAEADHRPMERPEAEKPTWQCLYCTCTRAYPARVPSNS